MFPTSRHTCGSGNRPIWRTDYGAAPLFEFPYSRLEESNDGDNARVRVLSF
jgi:hypothetical protein